MMLKGLFLVCSLFIMMITASADSTVYYEKESTVNGTYEYYAERCIVRHSDNNGVFKWVTVLDGEFNATCAKVNKAFSIKGSKISGVELLAVVPNGGSYSQQFIGEYYFGRCVLGIEYKDSEHANIWVKGQHSMHTHRRLFEVGLKIPIYLIPENGGMPEEDGIGKFKSQGLYVSTNAGIVHLPCKPFQTNAKRGDCEGDKPCSFNFLQRVYSGKLPLMLTFTKMSDVRVLNITPPTITSTPITTKLTSTKAPTTSKMSTTPISTITKKEKEQTTIGELNKDIGGSLMWIIVAAVVALLSLIIILLIVVVVVWQRKKKPAGDKADAARSQVDSTYGAPSEMESSMGQSEGQFIAIMKEEPKPHKSKRFY